MTLLEINRDTCIGCVVCVEVCPFGSLSMDDEDIAVVDETCTACGACLPECPVEAIYSEDEIPEGQEHFLELNAELSEQWPVITALVRPNRYRRKPA